MKKLTEKHKRYLLRRIREIMSRIRLRKFRRKVRVNHKSKRKYIPIKVPEIMDLNENFESTVSFFLKLRDICDDDKKRFFLDFKQLKHISPAAALAFTAEIDRVRKVRFINRLRVKDFSKWDTDTKLQLRDMGMFDLLGIGNLPKGFELKESNLDEVFIRFQSGKDASGPDAKKLQFLIYNIIKIAIPESKALQRGLTEAMTNSVQHAYPDDFVEESTLKDKLWWMSASINVRTKMLTIMFYDEGIGIPKPLPRTYPEIFRSLGGLLNDDAQLIQAATKIKRSSTNKKNRGRGLKDIKDYVKSVNNGMLKILSQRGEYAYFSNEKEYIKNRNIPLCGTLIQWKVPMNIGE